MKNDFENLLKNSFDKNNIEYNDSIINKIFQYIQLLFKWNQKINLISENDTYNIIDRHIVDSILLFNTINKEEYKNIVDLGSGNGFPGIIINIFHNNKNIVLIEQRNKKASFLKQVIYELQLTNIDVFDKNSQFFDLSNTDLILSRAVGDYKKVKKMLNLKTFSGKIGIYKKDSIEIF